MDWDMVGQNDKVGEIVVSESWLWDVMRGRVGWEDLKDRFLLGFNHQFVRGFDNELSFITVKLALLDPDCKAGGISPELALPDPEQDAKVFSPVLCPETETIKVYSFISVVCFFLRLKMTFDDIPGFDSAFCRLENFELFKFALIDEIANAVSVDSDALRIVSIHEGSIILNIELSSDIEKNDGLCIQEIAISLEQQAKDPLSKLRSGKYGGKIISLLVERDVSLLGGELPGRRMLKVDREISEFCKKRKEAIAGAPKVRKARQGHLYNKENPGHKK
jgi:hypothetical protein